MAGMFKFDGHSPKEIAKHVETIGVRRRHDGIAAVASVLLIKVAKHLALLACLMIIGKATGRVTIGELGIVFLTIFAATTHLLGRALALRLSAAPFKNPP